jgi:hypothetical protein
VKLAQQGLLAPKQEPQSDLQQRAMPKLEPKQLAQRGRVRTVKLAQQGLLAPKQDPQFEL